MCNCEIDHSQEKLPEFLYSNISLDKSECFNQSSDNNLKTVLNYTMNVMMINI